MKRQAAPVREQAVHRSFEILGAFDSEANSLSLAELHARTGIPKPTVHRIATELVGLRALARVDGRYRLGIRLFELGGLVPDERSLRDAAHPYLEDLYEATHDTVHLAVLDAGQVLYVDKLNGHRRVGTPSRIAGRLPLHCTAVGKALLANGPPAHRREVLRGPLAAKTPYTITSPGVLREELRNVRRTGVAYEREEMTLGVGCAAAPVFDAHGEVAGAISVSTNLRRRDPTTVAPQVRMAALALTRALQASGWSRR